MSLNLEGFRIEIARAMYDNSIGGLEGAPGWFEQGPDVRDGYIKLAAAGLAKMWEKDPKDLVDFFTGHWLEVTPPCDDARCERHQLCDACIVKILTHEKK